MKPVVAHPEKQHCTHGKRYEPIYGVWTAMRTRCNNPHSPDFPRYGGRGIKVCAEWDSSFEAFYAWAMSSGYIPGVKAKGCTLDRIDVNGDYCPENCRWVDARVQANNRRNTVYVTIDGVTKTISGWAEFSGLKRSTINNRYVDGVRGIALLHRADDTRFPKGYNRYGNSRHYDDYDDYVTASTIIEAEEGEEA